MLFSPSPKRDRPQLQLSERRLLLMAGDAIATIFAVFIALRIWAFVAERPFTPEFIRPQVVWFFILPGLWILLAGANDYYDLRIAASKITSFQRLVLITTQMLVVYLVIFFVSPRESLPRLFILYYGVLAFVFVGLWRFANPVLIGWASQPRRILIVGTDWAAQTIIDTIRADACDEYEINGIIGEASEVGSSIRGVPVIGSGRDLMNYVRRDGISEVIVSSTRELDGEIFQSVMDAYVSGVAVVPMPLAYETITERIPVEHVNNNWSVVLPIDGNTGFNPYPLFKRGIDIVLAVIGLLIFLVLLPFIALLIKLDSRGSVFYAQQRVGLNGRIFKMYKFRSMVQDAEVETGAVFAQKNDVRITRVGKFLRKSRLDELPQLYNVLKGDMSLVGPRPERPEHVQRLAERIPFYRTRLVVRPGVTGWAQVRYHYGANDEDALVKLQYDLYYLRHQSLALDLNIILRTVGKMLTMKGT
ncbi:MAG: sugar transferase [Chloroflexi bacterium]|nr:MAG: sugar transferase [Phototrophicales bacterium]RMF82288.1 MAG: sugar transferase [Chloroflexota bacterium]